MSYKSLLLIAAAALAISACSESKVETADAGTEAPDTGGRIEVKLPGGMEAKVDLPEGLDKTAKFDIDGVGLYPGARVNAVAVNASQPGEKGGKAIVDIGFWAPADAAVVADWYQQEFARKNIGVQRQGETLTGKTGDGDDFTLAMTPSNDGASGQLNIRDAG